MKFNDYTNDNSMFTIKKLDEQSSIENGSYNTDNQFKKHKLYLNKKKVEFVIHSSSVLNCKPTRTFCNWLKLGRGFVEIDFLNIDEIFRDNNKYIELIDLFIKYHHNNIKSKLTNVSNFDKLTSFVGLSHINKYQALLLFEDILRLYSKELEIESIKYHKRSNLRDLKVFSFEDIEELNEEFGGLK